MPISIHAFMQSEMVKQTTNCKMLPCLFDTGLYFFNVQVFVESVGFEKRFYYCCSNSYQKDSLLKAVIHYFHQIRNVYTYCFLQQISGARVQAACL